MLQRGGRVRHPLHVYPWPHCQSWVGPCPAGPIGQSALVMGRRFTHAPDTPRLKVGYKLAYCTKTNLAFISLPTFISGPVPSTTERTPKGIQPLGEKVFPPLFYGSRSMPSGNWSNIFNLHLHTMSYSLFFQAKPLGWGQKQTNNPPSLGHQSTGWFPPCSPTGPQQSSFPSREIIKICATADMKL